MVRLPRRLASRRRNLRRRQLAERKETATKPDAAAPENELRVEFGSLLFDMIRYDLMDEIAAGLSHLFDDFVEQGCMERPAVRLLENEDISPAEFHIYLSGKRIGGYPYPLKNGCIHKNILRDIYKEAERAPFKLLKGPCLSQDFLQKKEKEGSRESYLFLYRYFLRVADDRQQAFHWLKKLSAFGVPKDLQELSRAYERGIGCRRDEFLADKYDLASGGNPRLVWRNKKDLF